VKAGACNRNHGARRGMDALHPQHASPRDQRQDRQRGHDNYHHHEKCLNDLSHQ
jgi:hypothetical protein